MVRSTRASRCGSGGGDRRGGRARVAGVAVVALVALVSTATVSSVAAAQETAGQDEVRIVARLLANEKVEFGLQQRQADDSWGDRRLPRVRFFPADASVGRWLSSSPITVRIAAADAAARDAEVRIVARLLANGKIEFGLQPRQADDSWGDRQLPRVRFFPTGARVGRWLSSSPLTVTGARPAPETAAAAQPAGPLVLPLGVLPPAPGSCGGGSYDVPVPITDVVRGSASPAWRPDCAEIAYQQHVDLLAMRPDGEHLRDLWLYWTEDYTAQGAGGQPSWSPDGTRIAFAAENIGSDDPYWARHIWVMDADGSNATQLTRGREWDNTPSWSPNGSRIAFSRHSDDDTYVVIIDADGSNETPLTAGSTRELYPSWSPDGADIAFVAEGGQLVLMAPDGSNQRVIVTSNAFEEITLLDRMSWSPDSSQIAYTRHHDGCSSIVVMNADGTEPRRLTFLPGDSRHPAWSPDGELILFTNTPYQGYSRLFIVSAHAGSQERLDEPCAENSRYEPNQDLVVDEYWQVGIPEGLPPTSARDCRPPRQPGYASAGFPRPTRAPSVGTLRVAVLFVDFPDAAAPYSTRIEAGEEDNSSQGGSSYGNLASIGNYLEAASYGKLDIELIPLHRWLRARHSLIDFLFDPSLEFLEGAVTEAISVEAIELAAEEMDFSEIDVVMTVMPSAYFRGGRAAGVVQLDDKLLPTFQIGVLPWGTPNDTALGWGLHAPHELAHVLGLNDLYPSQQGGYQGEFARPYPPDGMGWVRVEAGLMGLQGNYLAPLSFTQGTNHQSPSEMLAWSRWQLGWLEPEQVRCITDLPATVTLTPIHQPGSGVAMAAIPVGDTELIVIESRRGLGWGGNQLTNYDTNSRNSGNVSGGVFVYTVDSSLTELPIRFATDDGGGVLAQSPALPPGTSITVKGHTITVIDDTDNSHTIQISQTAPGS